jgi:hypothetical protein
MIDYKDSLFCGGCQAFRPISDFHKRPEYYPGARQYSYDCKECKAAKRDRNDQLHAELLRKYGAACKFCGAATRPEKLDKEGHCNRCLSVRGLKVCAACKEQKLIQFDFYPHHAKCKICVGVMRKPVRRPQMLDYPRKCRRCQIEKQGADFYSKVICKECWDEGAQQYAARLQKREKRNQAMLKYRHMSKEDQRLAWTLLKTYGLDFSRYLEISTAQEGKCAICKLPPKTRLVVDHDHKTGKFRGLLCNSCNVGLGYFRDSQQSLQAACKYLEDLTNR